VEIETRGVLALRLVGEGMILFFLVWTVHFALPVFWMPGLGFLVLHYLGCVRITILSNFLYCRCLCGFAIFHISGYVGFTFFIFLDLVISVWSSSVPSSGMGPSSQVEPFENSFEELKL